MKKFAVLTVLALAACGDVSQRVFFEQPDDVDLSGIWAGTEEITTDDDLASNGTYGDYGKGFSFPVVIDFDGRGRFSLWTSNFSTSYTYPDDRTCSGIYTISRNTVRLLPNEQCRALPLSQYTIGRVLPDGITLEARTGNTAAASYVSMRVRFHLERD